MTFLLNYTELSGYPILLQTRDRLLQHRGRQRADNLISTLHPRTNQCQPFHEPLLQLLKFNLKKDSSSTTFYGFKDFFNWGL